MTLANRLTLLRLGLIPVFMVFMIVDNLWTRILALLIFIGASITDWYDGSVARRTGTVTVIGTFLDPLADKLLIAAALIGFVELRETHIPAWMVVLIVSREFLITGLRSLAAARGTIMAAERAGKLKTVSQMTAIITIFLILIVNSAFRQDLAHRAVYADWIRPVLLVLDKAPYWLMLVATVITVLSGYLYIRKYSDFIERELSLPRPRRPS